MKYANYSIAAAVALAGIVGLVGCNEGASSASASPTGDIVVSASLPNSPLGKSLIDQNTQIINVKVYTLDPYEKLIGDVNITKTSPTATIMKVPVGDFYATVTSYDSNKTALDMLWTGGTIAEGKNALVSTLIRGKWTLDAPVTFNKTLSTDTARIDSLSVIPNAYYYAANKSAIDLNGTYGWTNHPTYLNGANLPKFVEGYNNTANNYERNVTSTTETRWGTTISYLNQFKGLSTNSNALEDAWILLKPISGTVVREDLNNTREAFIMGIDPVRSHKYTNYEYNTTFSDPTASNYATSQVTAYNKMSGNIIESRTKAQNWTEKCYDENGTTVACPWNQTTTVATARKKAVTKAFSAKSVALGKSAANANNCYIDLNVTDRERGTGTYYDYNTSTYKKITYDYTYFWKGDACGHPFTATGTQLPQTDLNITIQKKR
ncbi:MAG: hypothetical protein M0P91_04115 [Sulfuricurvum sp.]|jgi:hypothetical protein|uniref:hypothetical protein n=1 Tax=Sulfuricurvum sp. TaxID=2025608 RepID=UPI0025DE6663|nr:hypothetical protein [Sulfuricurvum sp.]MCK9372358.1 hypothetical protein [Sulfuricurvum sp.]